MDPRGGGVIWGLTSSGQPTHPPTHPPTHIRNIFLRGKMKSLKGPEMEGRFEAHKFVFGL